MRRFFIVLLAGLASVSGCRWYDTLFGVMGSHYTDEGGSLLQKQHHYADRVESLRSDNAY
jgi:hypothetical protein